MQRIKIAVIRNKVAMISAVAFFGLVTVASAATMPAKTPADADASCTVRDLSTLRYNGNDSDDIWRLADNAPFMKTYGFTFDGWVNGGIMRNTASPATNFNGPVEFNDRDVGQLSQAYLSLARQVPENNQGFFLGGRADVLYGSDFMFTTAAGLDAKQNGNVPTTHNRNFTEGRSFPQLYLEAAYNDIKVKAGHFASLIGHEALMAKDNFFNTHTMAFTFGGPITDTGLLVSKPIDKVTVTAGLVNGWNQYSTTAGERNFANFLGRIAYNDSRFGAAFTMQKGKDSDFNTPGIGPFSDRTVLNGVASVNVTDRINYLIDGLYAHQQDTLGFNALNSRKVRWHGVTQELTYKFNRQWSAGGRFEWFDDPQGYLVTGLRAFNTDARFRFPGNFYDTSLGVNYRPHPNLTLRGEVREDWSNARGFVAPGIPGGVPNQPYNDNKSDHQYLFGLDAIVQF